MANDDRVGRVLEHLYKGAMGESTWASSAGLMNELIRTNGQSISYAEVGPGGELKIQWSWFFVGAERRDDLRQLYFRDYYWRDEAIPRLAGLDDRELAWKLDLYTDREMKASAAYNEFRVANKTEKGLFTTVHGFDGSAIVWSCGNSTEREGWGHDQVRVIELLAPHIGQAARFHRAMADARALGASLDRLIENRRVGLIRLDRCGLVVEVNDRARAILLKRDGLRDGGGVLTSRHTGENEELQRLLARALPRTAFRAPGVR